MQRQSFVTKIHFRGPDVYILSLSLFFQNDFISEVMKINLALMSYVYFRRLDVGQFTKKSLKKETRDNVSLFFHYILTMCLMIFRDGVRSENLSGQVVMRRATPWARPTKNVKKPPESNV